MIYRQQALIEQANININNDLVDDEYKKGIYQNIEFIEIDKTTDTEFDFGQDTENYNYVLNLVNPKGAL